MTSRDLSRVVPRRRRRSSVSRRQPRHGITGSTMSAVAVIVAAFLSALGEVIAAIISRN